MARRPTAQQARAYCRRLARRHYENFVVGSLALPRRMRPHFFSIYAYCRWADDLADETGDTLHSLRLLDWWEQQLDLCYAGTCRHPVFVALDETIREFEIPSQPFRDLLAAFRQDQTVARYETFADLLAYCRHSANPVGHLILYLARSFSPESVACADSICTGLQLANFWQDLARDADRGRVYVPTEDLDRFGYDADQLIHRSSTPEFLRLMQFEVDRAESYLRAGRPLIELVPRWLQADVELFIAGGLAVLQAIRDVGYDVWHRRPTVGRIRQMRLLLAAFIGRWSGRNFGPAR